jgi:N-acetylglutamate synthase-like GNAT family acetyltransferase
MKIRLANKFDLPRMLEMIQHFSEQGNMPKQLSNDELDLLYINKLFHHLILGAGIVLVAEKNNEVVGLIMGIKNSNIWYPSQIVLSELIFWIEPEHRKGRIGYNLLKEYNKLAEEMRQQNKITMYTMTKTIHFNQINYERFGYNKIEETWAIGV